MVNRRLIERLSGADRVRSGAGARTPSPPWPHAGPDHPARTGLSADTVSEGGAPAAIAGLPPSPRVDHPPERTDNSERHAARAVPLVPPSYGALPGGSRGRGPTGEGIPGGEAVSETIRGTLSGLKGRRRRGRPLGKGWRIVSGPVPPSRAAGAGLPYPGFPPGWGSGRDRWRAVAGRSEHKCGIGGDRARPRGQDARDR